MAQSGQQKQQVREDREAREEQQAERAAEARQQREARAQQAEAQPAEGDARCAESQDVWQQEQSENQYQEPGTRKQEGRGEIVDTVAG